jgi:HEAT repeat protein
MTHFCPNCWKEIEPKVKICPHCKADQNLFREQTFTQKLILALDHPEPETPIRAAYILGKLKTVEAIPSLLRIMRTHPDPYIVTGCVEALANMEEPAVIQPLERILLEKIPLIVVQAIQKALKKIKMIDH